MLPVAALSGANYCLSAATPRPRTTSASETTHGSQPRRRPTRRGARYRRQSLRQYAQLRWRTKAPGPTASMPSVSDSGAAVRVYLPYGRDWYSYLVRRLAERPANFAFFLRSLVSRS